MTFGCMSASQSGFLAVLPKIMNTVLSSEQTKGSDSVPYSSNVMLVFDGGSLSLLF
jgi:hypothetical protein